MTERPGDPGIEDAEIDDGAALAVPSSPLPATALPAPDYSEDGVPSFDYVRDQIEARFAASAGMGELASATPEAASLDERFTAREQAGRDRLEQIRRELRGK